MLMHKLKSLRSLHLFIHSKKILNKRTLYKMKVLVSITNIKNANYYKDRIHLKKKSNNKSKMISSHVIVEYKFRFVVYITALFTNLLAKIFKY